MMLSPEYNDLTKLVLPKKKRDAINSSEAITKYRVIDSNYGVSFLECQPVTGQSLSNRMGPMIIECLCRCQTSNSNSSRSRIGNADLGRSQIFALREIGTAGKSTREKNFVSIATFV